MPTGVSLHIGVNRVDPGHYAGWSGPLQACEADALDFHALAANRGFEARTLLTEEATRDAVVTAIAAAAEDLGTTDMFFLSYSGHGGQVDDQSGDEADAYDETWCLFDGQLLDDELHEQWEHFASGTRLLVVSDSCHSGTVTRAPQLVSRASVTQGPVAESLGIIDAGYRAMPQRDAKRTYRTNRRFYQDIQARIPPPQVPTATIRLLSGCQDNQYSLDGSRNGLFTGTLLEVWDDGGFVGNYSQFHKEIVKRMPPTQTPNHSVIGSPNPAFDAETPFTP